MQCRTQFAACATPLRYRKVDIIAAGWRRFQAVPVYATEDANGRLRALKYTPEHMHCSALVWGALAPPNTGGGKSQFDFQKGLGAPWRRPALVGKNNEHSAS